MKILLCGAELRGLAKVGGLGDVIQDLGTNLVKKGHEVRVMLPFYGLIKDSVDYLMTVDIPFEGDRYPTQIYQAWSEGVEVWLFKSQFFHDPWIYLDSSRRGLGPFEDDARRFAFFCAGIYELLLRGIIDRDWVWHLHDWHLGVLALLFRLGTRVVPPPFLLTIHNLDYQGQRPWLADSRKGESFEQWFPEIFPRLASTSLFDQVSDPKHRECFNPLRAAIILADKVNTVSPTYAKEVTLPDDPSSGFVGGRGLEEDLKTLEAKGSFLGILNGVEYSQTPGDFHQEKPRLLEELRLHLEQLAMANPPSFSNPNGTLDRWQAFVELTKTAPLFVTVTRAVSQKVGMLLERGPSGGLLWQDLLKKNLTLLVLGTGELAPALQEMNRYPNAMFLQAFSPRAAELVYSLGDVFLMPSDFEPCGLSQILAMAHGCPVLAHDRGGLHDTVFDGKTGFLFSGDSRGNTLRALISTVDRVISVLKSPSQTKDLRRRALDQRFDWTESLNTYLKLYKNISDNKEGAGN